MDTALNQVIDTVNASFRDFGIKVVNGYHSLGGFIENSSLNS